MTNTVSYALNNEDVYHNITTKNAFEKLQKKEVWGLGVKGKRFELIKSKDNFLKRIWFSFLKTLGFIKTDARTINNLSLANDTKFNSPDYKLWAEETNHVSKATVDIFKQQIASLTTDTNILHQTQQQSEREKASLRQQLTVITKERNSLRNQLNQQTGIIATKEGMITALQEEIEDVRNRNEELKKELKDKTEIPVPEKEEENGAGKKSKSKIHLPHFHLTGKKG